MQTGESQLNEFRVENLGSATEVLNDMSTYGYQNVVTPLLEKWGSITHIPDAAGASQVIDLYTQQNLVFKGKITQAFEQLVKYDLREMDNENAERYVQALTRLRNILLNICDVYIKLRRFSGICGDIETMCYEYIRVLNVKLGVEM